MTTNSLIHLRYGDWSCAINLSRGANCVSLKNEGCGISILREPPEDGTLDNPYLYGMPILFPVNRIEGGAFLFEGRKYVFPINEPNTGCHLHGMLHETPFELTESTNRLAVCRYRADEGEYLGFPHAFEIIQRYELNKEGLCHTVTLSNLSQRNMPVFLGFHTTFNTLFMKGCKPENMRALAEISEEYERNMEINYLPTGAKPPFDEVSYALCEGRYNPFDGRISRHYKGEGRMALTDIERGVSLIYDNDEKYKFRLIYNGAEDGYICLEPQTCLANCQNSPFSRQEAGFDFLLPKEVRVYKSKIFVKEIEKR